MHVSQLLDSFPRGPHIEIVEPRLPERPPRTLSAKQATLPWIPAFAFRQQSASGALLQNLHDCRRIPHLRFRDQQMEMFWHDHVSDDYESIPPSHLFENGKEAVAATSSAQEWQSPITRTGDKVQMVRAISDAIRWA